MTSPAPNLFYLKIGFFWGHRWCKAVHNGMTFGKDARVTVKVSTRIRVRVGTRAWDCARKGR